MNNEKVDVPSLTGCQQFLLDAISPKAEASPLDHAECKAERICISAFAHFVQEDGIEPDV